MMHKFSTAATKLSGVLHRPCRETRKRVQRIRRGQPVADPNRMSGTFFTRVASVLPSELFGRATRGKPPARPYVAS